MVAYPHFLFVVDQLTLSSPLLIDQDICVTVCVGDMSKITCPGDISKDGLTVTWNHPFLLLVSPCALDAPSHTLPHSTTHPSMSVEVTVCSLPEEFTPEWDKQPFDDPMVINVVNLLDSADGWQCELHFNIFW